jgi:hypothetical protein
LEDEDKNPMRKFEIGYDDDLAGFCQRAFAYKHRIMILNNATPDDRSELLGRALWISGDYEVKTFPDRNGCGTVIEFVKK